MHGLMMSMPLMISSLIRFFFNDTATTESSFKPPAMRNGALMPMPPAWNNAPVTPGDIADAVVRARLVTPFAAERS